MGTSISHSSPPTNNWRAVAATYLSESIGTERVIQEIWRAASHQPTGDMGSDLAQPVIQRCLQIALEARSPQDAYQNTARMIALSEKSTLATDIAKRAVVGVFLRKEERASCFVRLLFSGAVDYLISRDLPSYIGKGNRLENVTDSIKFKISIKQQVETIVSAFPISREIAQDPVEWKNYIKNVVASLAGAH